MQIDAIDVYYVKHPLLSPWKAGHGEETDIHAVLTRLHSGSFSGWSESAPFAAPTYCGEYAHGVFYLVSEIMAPLIVGHSFPFASNLLDRLSVFKDNPFAKSSLEIAWWTLASKMQSIPLYKMIGGTKGTVEAGADICMLDDIDTLLKSISETIEEGFSRIKLKIKPGWDLQVLQAVRSSFPKHTFHVDCNASYSLEDMPFFEQLDKFDLAMIEQPLHHADVHDHAKISSQIATPICLDESIHSLHSARQAIELGSCQYMNIKPGRVGGITNSIEIHNMCRSADIGCWIGSMLESSIGTGVGIALATLDNITYPSDLFPSSRFYAKELSDEEVVLSAPGIITLPPKFGTPFEPNMAELKNRTIMSKRIEMTP